MRIPLVNTEPSSGKPRLRFWKKNESKGTSHRRKSSTATAKSPVGHSIDAHDAQRRSFSVSTFFSKLSISSSVQTWKYNELVNEVPTTTRECKPLYPLPIELQLRIICELSFVDILSLRQTSKYFHQLITTHEASIVRHHVRVKVPPNIVHLYPPMGKEQLTLQFLGGLAHRQVVCKNMAKCLAAFIAKELFRCRSARSRRSFAPRERRIEMKMVPMLFTLFHHFEEFRDAYIRHLMIHGRAMPLLKAEQDMFKCYDSRQLLLAYLMYSFMCHCFKLRFRPPTYAGRLERFLRGWTGQRPSDECLAHLLLVGGLREMVRIWEVKNFNRRLKTLVAWRRNPPTRDDRIGYIRRSLLDDADWRRTTNESREVRQVPMPLLSTEELEILHRRMPLFWQIFVPAAEREILERNLFHSRDDIPFIRQFINELVRTDDEPPPEMGVGSDVDLNRDRRDVDAVDDANVGQDGNDEWDGVDESLWRIWMPPRHDDWV